MAKAPEKEPDHSPQFNPNGFMLPPPGPACFLYKRAESDSNQTPVHVHVDKQPPMVGVRQSNGALVYSEQEKADYQGWYHNALPKLPPLDFEGEIRTLDHWNQALDYAYQKHTNYPPPFMGGDTLVGGGETDLPGRDLGEKIDGAMTTEDTNPEVNEA